MLWSQSEAEEKTFERWGWRERESKRDLKSEDISHHSQLWVGHERTIRDKAANTGKEKKVKSQGWVISLKLLVGEKIP